MAAAPGLRERVLDELLDHLTADPRIGQLDGVAVAAIVFATVDTTAELLAKIATGAEAGSEPGRHHLPTGGGPAAPVTTGGA